MRKRVACILLSLTISLGISFAQDRSTSISVSSSLITSSKLFHHPDDADELLRSEFLPLNTIFSVGIDVRRTIEALRIQIGVSAEYVRKSDVFYLPASDSKVIPVRDGFVALPIELSGYFTIPVGTDNFHIYMGGGAGIYFGKRTYEYAGVEAATIERTTGYGIHILSGMEYTANAAISIRSELKFRDIQFETVNKFQKDATTYNGSTLLLDQEPLTSRINIDGMTVNLGLVFHF